MWPLSPRPSAVLRHRWGWRIAPRAFFELSAGIFQVLYIYNLYLKWFDRLFNWSIFDNYSLVNVGIEMIADYKKHHPRNPHSLRSAPEIVWALIWGINNLLICGFKWGLISFNCKCGWNVTGDWFNTKLLRSIMERQPANRAWKTQTWNLSGKTCPDPRWTYLLTLSGNA